MSAYYGGLLACLLGLGLSGCGQLKDVAIIPGLTDALTKQVDVAPAYFENLATDYETASRRHLFLTGRSCDQLDTPGIKNFRKIDRVVVEKGKRRTITYAEYEQRRFAIKSGALNFLMKYAQQIKERSQAAEDFTKVAGYATTTADIASSIPIVGAQAAPYAAAAKSIVSVLNRFATDISAAAIVAIAKRVDPNLQKIVRQIKIDFGVINVDAKIYLAAWEECQFARLMAMRRPQPGVTLASAVEIDEAYAAVLKQAVEYRKSIPTVDDELDAIVKANAKIANNDFSSVLNAAQEMVGAATAAYSAIQAVQKLPAR